MSSLIGQRAVRASQRPEVAVIPGGTPEGPAVAMHEHLAASREHLDHIARTLRAMAGPGVLETATVTIGPTGALERSYRVPFGAVTVLNLGGAPVIVTSAATQGSAPGGGQGQVSVPGGALLAFNMSGQTITFYGRAGAQIVYTTHTGRIPPSASYPGTTSDTIAQGAFAAAGAGTATLPPGYSFTGFDITCANVTVAASGLVTLTGTVAPVTPTWELEVINGANSPTRLIIRPPRPIPAASLTTSIVLNVPAITGGPAGQITLYGS